MTTRIQFGTMTPINSNKYLPKKTKTKREMPRISRTVVSFANPWSILSPSLFLATVPRFRLALSQLVPLFFTVFLASRRHHANLYITSAITCRHKSHRQIKFWRDSLADINFGIRATGEMAVTWTCVHSLLLPRAYTILANFPPPFLSYYLVTLSVISLFLYSKFLFIVFLLVFKLSKISWFYSVLFT